MKKFDKEAFCEKIRKHSGEIIVAIVALILLITVISISVPFLSELFNKEAESTAKTVTASSAEEEPSPEIKLPNEQDNKPDNKPAPEIETKPEPTPEPEPTPTPIHTHAHKIDRVINPTCLEKGYSVYLCSCGDTYNADYTDALGHNWGEWVITKQPTKTAEGTETRTCKRCNITENRSIDKLPHSHAHAVDSVVNPTCLEKGYSVYLCSCGDTYNADYTDALGHNWGEWVITKQPTETTEGTETRTCKRCNITENRSVNKLTPTLDPAGYFYWKPITVTGLENAYIVRGRDVWTDNKGISYYSCGNDQYVFDKANNTWKPVTWKGHTYIVGRYIWTDGENTYYSTGEKQFVLNGDTWVPKTWNGLTDFCGLDVWTDGENIYYSAGEKQFVLNGDTWVPKTWDGDTEILENIYGEDIWSDGTNIYYSFVNRHYVLDGNTWKPKVWNGLNETSVFGHDIWTDGTNIYYSGDKQTNQWQLNTKTDTWFKRNWIWKDTTYKPQFTGEYVWTDGTDIYYFYGSWYYVLDFEMIEN